MPEVKQAVQIQPYLFFEGRCEEAIEFYRQALDARLLILMRYNENPEPCQDGMEGLGDKVMHATIQIGDAHLMVSDGRCQSSESFQGFSIHLSLPDRSKLERYFAALSEGGNVVMPLTKTFWSSLFGMVGDRFGVQWMLSLPE